MVPADFEDIGYLLKGNERQKAAYQVLTAHCIFEYLIEFDPILVGTIPLAINTATSDLDILCCFSDPGSYLRGVTYCFENYDDFHAEEERPDGSVVIRFRIEDFGIELYGSRIPTREQPGFRHMIAEFSILEQYGDDFRQKIVSLKEQGIKTEPAFAMLLGLTGDPYEELLHIKLT